MLLEPISEAVVGHDLSVMIPRDCKNYPIGRLALWHNHNARDGQSQKLSEFRIPEVTVGQLISDVCIENDARRISPGYQTTYRVFHWRDVSALSLPMHDV